MATACTDVARRVSTKFSCHGSQKATAAAWYRSYALWQLQIIVISFSPNTQTSSHNAGY